MMIGIYDWMRKYEGELGNFEWPSDSVLAAAGLSLSLLLFFQSNSNSLGLDEQAGSLVLIGRSCKNEMRIVPLFFPLIPFHF